MPAKISVTSGQVVARVKGAFDTALPMLCSEIREDCNRYVKMDTGALRDSSYLHSNLAAGEIVWQTPYAKFQYWTIDTAHKDVNPNATWRWCETAKQRHGARWAEQAERLMEGNL